MANGVIVGSRRQLAATAVVCLSAVLVSAGCTDDAASDAKSASSAQSADASRVPTRQELNRLASSLAKNTELGGAHFRARVENEAGGNGIAMSGLIDWSDSVGSTGEAQITFTFSDGRPKQTLPIWWHSGNNPTIIMPTTSEQQQQFAENGLPRFAYGATVPSPKTVPLHLLLQFINAGAATRAENPTLLTQKGSVQFLRSARVGAHTCDVFQFGTHTIYWVGRNDGVLYRFEAQAQALGSVTITYSKHGRPRITLPAAAEVASIAQMSTLSGGN